MKSGLSIGATATRTGCSVATIRYYEEMGLLRPVARNDGGRRVYGMPDVERLRLIRRLRSMDFGLDAVRGLLRAMEGDARSCLSVRDVALGHLAVVRARRAEMDALERTLVRLARSCTDACANGPTPDCTIMDDLALVGGQAVRGP
ncbi:MAG: MerR family transcriptional regulator [Hyphomonadaceae bacterium]|nr:MerR family transcriptional regulator [Hyphomonadaceae bacterium]